MKILKQLFKRRHYRRIVVYVLTYLMFFNPLASVVIGGPEGAQVVNGDASFHLNGNNTTITVSDKAIINYSSFDIAQPETVQFIQPHSDASVLNRILSANPTNINGTLLANGRVFFVNPAGVYIGSDAVINVNQLVASGLNITNSDFIDGKYNFAGGNGSVINNGDISAEQVYLIGKQVTNSGNISCPAGYVVMAAGDRVFLGEPGSDIVLEVDGASQSEPVEADLATGVINEGTVEASGGIVALAATGDLYSQAISNVGSISTSVETGKAGQVKLTANGGEVINTGTIEASGTEGGQVTMEGARVGQFGTVQVNGTGNGGNVDLTASDVVALGSNSITTANAGVNGDGGDVIVYSPDTALFRNGARIEAKGGIESGDGGFIEVSGKKHVEVFGAADASATNGIGGLFFIDPYNITIQAAAGTLDGLTPNFIADAADSTVGETVIETQLNNGTSVLIRTANGVEPTQSGHITQNVQIDKNAGGSATITYDAAGDIVLNSGIVSTDGQLNVVMQANSTTGGDVTGTGSVDINAAVTTNGGTFTSSGVNFDNTGGSITTDGGGVNLDHTGVVTVGANMDTSGGAGGAITVDGSSVNLNEQLIANDAGISVAVDLGIVVDNDAPAEIITNGTVSLTADTISGPGSHALDIDGATALTVHDTGAGDIILSELTDSTITSTTIIVDNLLYDNIDIAYQGGDEVHINNNHEISTVTLDHDFSYTATAGSITVDAIDTGTSNVTLSTAGAITDGTGADTAANITASEVTLNAGTGIGGTGNADIDTAVETLTAHVTGAGGIYIEDTDGITLADVDTSAGNIEISTGGLLTAADVDAAGLSDVTFTTSSGGMNLQSVTAGRDITAVASDGDIEVGSVLALNTIQLTANTVAGQKITDADDNSNLQASTVTLTSKAGIGDTSHHVNTDTATLNAHVTEAGDIYMDESDAINLADIDTFAGDIVISAGGSLTGTSVVSTDGSVNLSAGGLLTATDVQANDSGDTGNYDVDLATSSGGIDLQSVVADHDITATATAGNIEVDSILADNLVQLAANAGAITDGTIADTAANITASNVTLNTSTGIGGAGDADIDTDIGSLIAHVTGTGGIYIQDADGINLENVDTADGAIVVNAGGSLTAMDVQAAGVSDVIFTTSSGGMDLQSVSAGRDVTAVASDGDIEVGSVLAQNTILLTANTVADQKITDIDDNSNLQAPTATLIARAGIGDAAHPVGTNVDTLNAHVTGTGDIYVDEASSINLADVDTFAGDIVISAGGSLDGTSVVSTDGSVSLDAGGLLTATDVRANDSGSTGNYDVTLTTSVGGMDLQSVTADDDITVTAATGDIEVDSLTAGNSISLEATAGAITQGVGTITANGGFLAIRQMNSLDTKDFQFTNQANTNLTLESFDGSVTSVDLANGGKDDNAADQWKSVTATAENNIILQGNGDIKIGGDLTSDSGGVSILSNNGGIYDMGSYDYGTNVGSALDNVSITGSSASGSGVNLPFGSGKAAIMLRSSKDLILGPSAVLSAKGNYSTAIDDRSSVGFDTSPSEGGDSIDVAIYLGNYWPALSPISRDIAVNSLVSISDNGTMVVDAGDTVTFGGEFKKSVFNVSHRLEVVSRRSDTLESLRIIDDVYRLPFAFNPDAVRSWFDAGFDGAYVLRGVKTLLAEILGLTNPVPLAPPRPLEPEVSGEVEGPDTEALVKLLNELGIGVQPYVTDAYATSLSTDLRLYSAAEKLQVLIPILEDEDETRITGLRTAVARFFPSLDVLSEEKMDSFAQELGRHRGDGTDYDLAGQCIFALAEYVNILGNDIGWPVEKSVGFVMGRYVPRLTEGDEIRIAVIQMHLQKVLGV